MQVFGKETKLEVFSAQEKVILGLEIHNLVLFAGKLPETCLDGFPADSWWAAGLSSAAPSLMDHTVFVRTYFVSIT